MLKRLLITGAAGRVGGMIMPHLQGVAQTIRLSDLRAPQTLPTGAEFVSCDLSDRDAVLALVEGCDGIIHLGGIAEEDRFDAILPANIVGVHNLYEAARKTGSPRILFASSNHVVGYYQQDERLDAKVLPRPDSWYAVSKVYGEAVASFYFHKFGIETAVVRIGSCFEEITDRRMLVTWLSAKDLAALAKRVFTVPRLGCPIIYGVSDNDEVWWDNAQTAYLGWRPTDTSRDLAHRFTAEPGAVNDLTCPYQGGRYTDMPIMDDET